MWGYISPEPDTFGTTPVMPSSHLTIAFEDNFGHSAMAALTRQGYLWCRDTSHNRANAEGLWSTVETMRLTLTSGLARTPDALATILDSALEHHPEVTSLVVTGFADQSAADGEAIAREFASTEVAFSYRRNPTA